MNKTLFEDGVCVRRMETVDSTNSEARRYCLDGGTAPALFIAKEQTAGRGRMGRSFYSPAKTGMYMTVLMDVSNDAQTSVVKLTSAAAVAAVRTITVLTGIECGIKWVNDIYVHGRKVCGILAESFFVSDKRYAIIGVGINLSTEEFPSELADVAGSLGVGGVDLADRMACALYRELSGIYAELCQGNNVFMDEYRKRSVVLGRQVTYTVNGDTRRGMATEVTDDGGLTVERADGIRETLTSGEITLRLSAL